MKTETSCNKCKTPNEKFLEYYFCRKCNEESQKKRMEEIYQDQVRDAEQQEADRFNNRFKQINIGPRFKDSTFENYTPENDEAKKVLKFCTVYAEKFDKVLEKGAGILMVGSCGTGKNHLASAIAMNILDKGYTPIQTTAIKLVRRIKATWARDSSEDEQEVIGSFTEPDLLIIDEVGVQFGSKTEELLITEIINNRYEERKPTILISNETIESLEKIIGFRAIDRFHEDGSRVLVFNWSSYRRK